MSTNLIDLENDLKNKKLNSIYLLYGEEKYLIQEYVKKIKKCFGELYLGINYILLDESNIDSLISDIETPAFGYDKKLILIKNSNLFKKDNKSPIKDKFKEYLINNTEIINESVVILFIEETVHKMDFYKNVEKYARAIEFKELKPFEIKNRIKKICSLYKVKISDQNLDYFIEVAGTKMENLINEIRKLIEFAGENNEISHEDIEKLTIKDIEAVIFDLTDYLGEKNTKNALEILDNLIYNKEPLQRISITLYNHFKKIYFCKLAIEEKKDIATSIGLKPNQLFLVGKYRKQASCFSEKEIKNLLNELINLDYKSKNGMIDLEIGLKSILCKNC